MKPGLRCLPGNGGNGCISFRREKYVPKGGPNGGDGGTGGSVVFRATRDKTSLLDFKFRPRYEAAPGEHGMGRDCYGRKGQDLVLLVPVGTRILDGETNEVIVDLATHDQSFIAAEGGRGGLGNIHFTTSTCRAPRIATPGKGGEARAVRLELRMLADVGLVGLPNAGKSSFLRVISNARPQVADYPFTTLQPHLGVVDHKSGSFIVADIPGLIEGASQGAGLGHRFLKHAMRSRVLLHLVECTASPLEITNQIRTIEEELAAFDPSLVQKHRLVLFTKCDLLSPAQLERKRQALKRRAYEATFVSSHTHDGVQSVLDSVGRLLSSASP